MFEGHKLVAGYKKLVGELRAAHFVKIGKNAFDIEPNYYQYSPQASEAEIGAHFSSVVDFLTDVKKLREKLQQRVHLPNRSAQEKIVLGNLDEIHTHLYGSASEHLRELLELHQDEPLPLVQLNNTGIRKKSLAPQLDRMKVAEIAARHLRALEKLK